MLPRLRRKSSFAFAMIGGLVFMACAAGQETPRPTEADKAISDAVAAFVNAFNAHDAAAVAARWKEDAVHIAKGSGERTAGRQAIQDSYSRLFTEDPNCALRVSIGDRRLVSPDVVHLVCIADVRHGSGEVSRSELTAILVRQADGWLIDQVHETDMALFSPASLKLSQLAWLLGHWVDEAEGHRVVSETSWAINDSFLVRTYRLEQGGATTRTGTQVIGWDAEQQCIRCWLFDGSGSFGEGTWLPDGDKKWINKMVMKLAAGHRGSLTQVYELSDDGKLTIATIDREIDGEAQPNGSPVSLVRPGSEPAATEKSAPRVN